ncbi:MAG: AsmA family protein [Pseudorhodoplanes sp.]|nr:AsmA family protein [Pseudorhodoplanes sp.]
MTQLPGAGVQTTLLGLAIALILALLTALIGPLFIDWSQYRPAFEMQASRALGLPVRVSGPIDVRLLPSPSLLLSGIDIGSDSAQQPLRAKALGIELALGSLIRGQLRATELRLVGPDVAAGLGKDGRLNVPNLAVGFNLNDISIGKLTIEDARVSLADAASGKQAVFEKLWFGGDVRSLGAGIFRGEGAFVLDGGLYGYRISTTRSDDGDTKIKLSLEPSDIPLLADSEGTLSFADGAPRFEGALTLTRPVGVVLADGKTILGEPWRITSRVTATQASALFEQLELQYGPEERALKATGTAEMTFGGNPHVEAVVSARQIDLDRALASQGQPRRDPASAIKALAEYVPSLSNSPLPLQIGFGIDGVTLGGGTIQSLRGDVSANAGGISFKGVEFRAPGFTQVQVGGRLTTANGLSFSGPAEISSVDPRAFLAWLEGKTETSSGSASPFRGRGEIIIDDSKLAIERLSFEVDRKPVNGRLAYRYPDDSRKARLDAELRAVDVDIDAMMALGNVLLKDSKIEKPGELSLVLEMERARFAGLDAQRAHVKASFDAGGLKIDRLNIGDFGGARIDARGLIDTASASPRGSMSVDLDARDLSGLTALVAKFAPQSLELTRGISERAGNASLHATLEVGAASGQPAGQSLARFDLGGRLGKSQLSLKGTATGTMANAAKARLEVDGELTSDDAGALVRMAGLDRLITADNSPARISVSARGPLNGNMRVDGSIASAHLDASTKGHLRPFSDQGLSGDFDLAIARADAGALLQQGRYLPVTLTTNAAITGKTLKLDQLSAKIAGAPVRGRLGMTFGPVIDVEGDIEADAINATDVVAAATGFTDGKLISEEPFSRGLYAQASGRIAFRVRNAGLTHALSLHGVKGVLRLAPSDLGIELEEAEFAKGRVSGEISARKTPDGVSAKARIALNNVDAAAMLAGREQPPISGRINLGADFDGAGRSPKALIGSLAGAGTLTLADARIHGLDPKAFAVAMRAVDQGLPLDGFRVRDIVQPALEAGVLQVRAAETPFTISAGQVRFGTVTTQAHGADVTMSGVLDLTEGAIDSRIMLTDAAATTSAGRPEISVSLKGPVGSPARTIEVAALTGWLALRAVEQQSQKLEAIERASVPPATSSVSPASTPPQITLPEQPPLLPRTKPAAELRAAPLPPPIDIKPAPGFAPVQGAPRPQSRPAPQILPPPRESSF